MSERILVVDDDRSIRETFEQHLGRSGHEVETAASAEEALALLAEFEPGLVNHDLKAFFETIAPENGVYRHEETWHDDNGHAHVRASALGPSVTIPIVDGRLTLGTWQQIVVLDFDTRPRRREIVVQVVGE